MLRPKAEHAVVKDCTTRCFCLKELQPEAIGPFGRAFGLFRPAGRMNASAADRAAAWLQGTDRLEAAGDRRKPPHYRFRGFDLAAYAAGRRYRRHPDSAHGHPAWPHRARRAVRGLRLLHADLL